MDGIDKHCAAIRKLRALGVIHFKAADFEVTLGYPFDEVPKPTPAKKQTGEPEDAFTIEHAADLVLNPPKALAGGQGI